MTVKTSAMPPLLILVGRERAGRGEGRETGEGRRERESREGEGRGEGRETGEGRREGEEGERGERRGGRDTREGRREGGERRGGWWKKTYNSRENASLVMTSETCFTCTHEGQQQTQQSHLSSPKLAPIEDVVLSVFTEGSSCPDGLREEKGTWPADMHV